MVLADSSRISRAPLYSGYHYGLKGFRLRGYHSLWLVFPDNSTNFLISNIVVLQPHLKDGLGFSLFARHY